MVKKDTLQIDETARKFLVGQSAVIVGVERYCAQHIFGVRLSCALSTEQTQNQEQSSYLRAD